MSFSPEDIDKEAFGRWIVQYLESEGLPMSAVQGLTSALAVGKANPLTLQNGFSNFAGGYAGASYRATPGGGIQLQGLVQKAEAAALGTVIAELPAATRPKERQAFLVAGALEGIPEPVRVDVTAAGQVLFLSEGVPTYVSLSGIVLWPGS